MSSLYQKVESLFTAKILNVLQLVDAANHLLVEGNTNLKKEDDKYVGRSAQMCAQITNVWQILSKSV